MTERIFVTGLGIISAIGNNVQDSFQSIVAQKSGIGAITILSTRHRNEIPACEIKLSDNDLFEIAKLKIRKGYSRTALLGIIAAKEAITNAKLKDVDNSCTGLISSTSVGGMDKTELFYNDFLSGQANMIYVASHDCGDSTEKIADTLGIKGFISTISTACSGSANSIMFGARLIKHNILDRVIVGGTDSLTKFTLNGFSSLQILSKTGCKPFDENRDGITLGEGAAFLVLESEKSVSSHGKEIICELKGYGNACDAYHQTATSPSGEGPYLAMKKAIAKSDLLPEEIDYINAHGTGTVNNDLSEGRAIERIFNSKIPPTSSTKSYTGHCLGASGSIESVISSLAIQNNLIFPNLNFTKQMKELSFEPVTNLIKNAGVKNVLSNSFGFGGNNITLIFSRC